MVSSSLLQQWCIEITALPQWLFEESYHTVGDLAETIALLLPEKNAEQPLRTLSWYITQFILLQKKDEAARKTFVTDCWMQMDREERFVFNKLITGGFRIGVSQKTMVNALAATVQLDANVIAHRISGNWDPATTSFSQLLSEESVSMDFSKPYPFYLAYALEEAFGCTWQSCTLAGRMEMGWYPRATDKKKRRIVCMEPWRRTDDG